VPRRAALALSLTTVLALTAPVAGAAPALASTRAPRVVAAAPRTAVLPAAAAAALRVRLAGTLSTALAGSTAGTLSAAVDVDGVGPVLRRDSAHALPPASTRKSFVVSAALLALGRDARTPTSVAATATVTAGRLPGSLWLVAGGDPYLTTAGLTVLAARVRAGGVTVVRGDLLLDDTRYDGLRRAPGWKAGFVPDELGPLSALALDGNAGRRDAAYLRDPALPNTERFRALLAAQGVRVLGRVRRAPRPASARTLTTHDSLPLSAVTTRLLKASDNFAAEMLLKEVGRRVGGVGSTAVGVSAVRTVLTARGVDVGPAVDGSGLSAWDQETTAGQLSLLRAVDASPVAASLRAALPVACVDGTLVHRMCGTAGAGTVVAKTGTLSGETALAGYTVTRTGRRVLFAFQLTGLRSSASGRAAIDRAVVALTNLTV
jgi:D-alanyl-D-alanine carboxypeptidase/D-alanyl-D-alanine-endopeptidase (penicillin-binding protein 4)